MRILIKFVQFIESELLIRLSAVPSKTTGYPSSANTSKSNRLKTDNISSNRPSLSSTNPTLLNDHNLDSIGTRNIRTLNRTEDFSGILKTLQVSFLY